MGEPTKVVGTVAESRTLVATNQVTLGIAAVQLASVEGHYVLLKADSANTNKVYIGVAGVTTETGFELSADQFSPFIPIGNANQLYVLGGAGGQKLHVLVLS